MKSCPRCLNLLLAEDLSCSQCGTVVDMSLIPAGRTQFPPRPQPSPPPPVPLPPGASPARRGNTMYFAPGAATPPVSEERSIILAVLVTNMWSPGGLVFPIHAGHNRIGRSAECSIFVPQDPTLAPVHSEIIFAGDAFTLHCLDAGSATSIDGTEIGIDAQVIHNYSRIRTGSTEWAFVIVDQALTRL